MYLKRRADQDLISWINDKNRKPLVITGSRQCGKTTTVLEITKQYYKHVCYLNLVDEINNQYLNQFKKEPSIQRLCTIINSLYPQVEFNENTVIVLDEVQEVTEFFSELKTINERHKNINIIILGSYLGMKLFTDQIFMPIGQYDLINMYSLSFDEYLENLNMSLYMELLDSYKNKSISDITHEAVMDYYNKYLITGGFPEVVKILCEKRLVIDKHIYQIRGRIYSSYVSDIYRYVDTNEITKTNDIFKHALKMMGLENNNFVFSIMNKCARFREYEFVINLLAEANICFKVNNSEDIKFPLSPKDRVNKFKLFFNDISLVTANFGLTQDNISSKDFDNIKGNLAENFVMLELLRNGIEPYFHTFKFNSNQYEIDCLYEKDLRIKILEIKSGKKKKSPSLSTLHALNPNIDYIKLSATKNISDTELPIYLAFTLKGLY